MPDPDYHAQVKNITNNMTKIKDIFYKQYTMWAYWHSTTKSQLIS